MDRAVACERGTPMLRVTLLLGQLTERHGWRFNIRDGGKTYVVMTLWDLGPVAESPSLVAFVSHVAIEQGRATHSDMTS